MTQKYCAICGRMIFGTPRRLLVAEVDCDDNIQQIPGLTSLASCRWMCPDCYSRITMGILTEMIDKPKTDPAPKPEGPVKRKRTKKDRRETMAEKPHPIPDKATHKPLMGTVVALYRAGWSRERIADDIGVPTREVTEMCAQAHADGLI